MSEASTTNVITEFLEDYQERLGDYGILADAVTTMCREKLEKMEVSTTGDDVQHHGARFL